MGVSLWDNVRAGTRVLILVLVQAGEEERVVRHVFAAESEEQYEAWLEVLRVASGQATVPEAAEDERVLGSAGGANSGGGRLGSGFDFKSTTQMLKAKTMEGAPVHP